MVALQIDDERRGVCPRLPVHRLHQAFQLLASPPECHHDTRHLLLTSRCDPQRGEEQHVFKLYKLRLSLLWIWAGLGKVPEVDVLLCQDRYKAVLFGTFSYLSQCYSEGKTQGGLARKGVDVFPQLHYSSRKKGIGM